LFDLELIFQTMLQDFWAFVNYIGNNMRLYIVRHGIAVAHGTSSIAEDERPLTPEGIEKMKRAAVGLNAFGVAPELIFSSPLPRALQTAEIVLAACERKVPLKLLPALAPGGNRSEVYHELGELAKLGSIMIVGHQPSLGEIAGEIAWGSPNHYVELKKGGACALDLECLKPVPRGSLIWLITPSILRQAAS
jgi:phosphohistidine phosphatase